MVNFICTVQPPRRRFGIFIFLKTTLMITYKIWIKRNTSVACNTSRSPQWWKSLCITVISLPLHCILFFPCLLHSAFFQLFTILAAFIPWWLRAATFKPQAQCGRCYLIFTCVFGVCGHLAGACLQLPCCTLRFRNFLGKRAFDATIA